MFFRLLSHGKRLRLDYRSSWFMTDVGRPTTTFCLCETSLGGGLPDSTSFYFTPLDGWNLQRSASHVGSSSPLVSIDSPTPLLEGSTTSALWSLQTVDLLILCACSQSRTRRWGTTASCGPRGCGRYRLHVSLKLCWGLEGIETMNLTRLSV